jgi:hypothetical protein
MPRLGDKVDIAKAVKGPPPVVLAIQPQAYFRIEKPEELKHWEQDAQKFLGMRARPGLVGAGTESCSGGCSDDCDMD